MLYGSAATPILWLAARLLAVWPSGTEIPVMWPALLGATLLAWTQALTWMRSGLPGLRVIVAVLCLAGLDTVVLLAIHYNVREPMMVALLAPQIPLAYLAARFAVARARRGVVPDWRGKFARDGNHPGGPTPQRRHFPSPRRAQRRVGVRRACGARPGAAGLLCSVLVVLWWLPA